MNETDLKTTQHAVDAINNAIRLLREGKAIEAAGVLWAAVDPDPVPRFSALEENHDQCHVTQAHLEKKVADLRLHVDKLQTGGDALATMNAGLLASVEDLKRQVEKERTSR